MTQMIYDDYIAYCEKYCTQYGDKTVVLMEVGSFFELYAIDNPQEKAGADIYSVSDLLNLQVSRKNKSIIENNRGNPLLAGFPSHALSKHSQCLVANGYTVVLVRQVTAPPNPQREVTEILSPAMQLQPSGVEGNYLLVAMWDKYEDTSRREQYVVGVAGVDVSTGATFVYEVASSAKDPNLSTDEFVRICQTYQPKELVLLGSSKIGSKDIQSLETLLGVRFDNGRSIHRIWSNALIGEYAKVAYQNMVMRRAYPDLGMLDPIDALHLERYDCARTAFVYMIQFGYEHNENVIRFLQAPKIYQCHGFCTLEYNSAVQLNVIASPGGNEKPLMAWLNRCATAFGSRRFRERLLQPVTNAHELRRRYDEIDSFLEKRKFEGIHQKMKDIMDLERMVRRMRLGTFAPTDWPGLDHSMRAIHYVVEQCNPELLEEVCACMHAYKSMLDLDECAKYLLQDIRGNIFREGIFQDVDVVVGRWKMHWEALSDLACALERLGATNEANPACCRIEHNDRDGFYLTTTKRRWQAIEKQAGETIEMDRPISMADFSVKPISATSSTLRIRHPWIDECSEHISKAAARIQQLVTYHYKEFLESFISKHRIHLERIIDVVAELDICVTNAKNAWDYNYTRPQVSDGGTSHVSLRGMRHPILERILEREAYVPNDVQVGANGEHGILLFGINASGKSSLMKAVGLNVLMAQAGMFVAANAMDFVPYNHIFTRIASMDNIYKGWSTFTVEMLELKNILHRCDATSLVLGDELCSGTESVSALAIVSAGIHTLCQRGATFIFATHLHDLANIPLIRAMQGVSMQHMHIEIDASGAIVYDRKLRPGNGSSMYGLEVCKGLGLPAEFLKVAHEVRCDVQGICPEFQSTVASRYNSKVKLQECQVCGQQATETHHILQQKDAQKNGYIGHIHKDDAHNLVNLCEACHQEVHHGSLHINGYMTTTDGVRLSYGTRPTPLQQHKEKAIDAVFERCRYAHGAWWLKKNRVWRQSKYEEAAKVICKVSKCGMSEIIKEEEEESWKQRVSDPSMPLSR
jgi:DNA mismatch repair protein MutS